MNNAEKNMLAELNKGPVKVLCNINQFATLESLRDRGFVVYGRMATEHEASARFAYITDEGRTAA